MALERGECVCGEKLEPGKTFCSWPCSSAWALRRSMSFANTTNTPTGKPKDGVTYAVSKRGKKP